MGQVGRIESEPSLFNRMENENVEESMRYWGAMFPKIALGEPSAVSPGRVGPWPTHQQAPEGPLEMPLTERRAMVLT